MKKKKFETPRHQGANKPMLSHPRALPAKAGIHGAAERWVPAFAGTAKSK
jgi:hypothetical protein